ncbi:MAG TPA: hypothetical protein VFH55_01710 [Nitrospiria bacterium]|nr:hypothetical protein [Nitrospiria bacterium]
MRVSGRSRRAGVFLFCTILLSAFRISSAETGVLYNGQDGTLALTVKDASLKETLKQIGDAAGIRMYISPVPDQRLTLSFGPLPLEEAINRVIHPYNHAVIYEQERDSAGKTVTRPVGVKIFQKSPAESTLLLTEKASSKLNDREIEEKMQKMKKEGDEQPDPDPKAVQPQTADDYLARKEEYKNRMKARSEQIQSDENQDGPATARPPKPGVESP